MRDLFDIISSTGSHPVQIADGGLREIISHVKPSIILADAFFAERLRDAPCPTLFLQALETTKEFAQLGPVIEKCRQAGLTRSGMILAIGGGIIQDISCFIASVYMRGARWTYAPTTLLGMVDSCIGGKSSINVGDFKNLIGTFYPPQAVIIPTDVLGTLPTEHIAAGRSEAAKICFAKGNREFDQYLALDGGPMLGDATAITELSLGSKKWFVETDEFDRGERLLLNFGHSFGHALESCSDYGLPHGVAVGIGCLAAIEMSLRLHDMSAAQVRVDAMTRQLLAILGSLDGLDAEIATVKQDRFFAYFDSDKKHSPTHYQMILVGPNGQLRREKLNRTNETREKIWAAFQEAGAQFTASRGSEGSPAFIA
ncbi:3-dehydroquinate synthase [Sphingomonas vulcanisoli]|uniref:3-dehydroquinate synthase n=1 Tax=Sphingomonas vulcanisoli TaxID=1658060 RepID=A0ABX0U0B3_9SPHN|nr:3-dehydroquinate synthase family protein [Sphingomonas vulcanisoli]NIJ09445.1 3-dehydroquinate synthase [Sphingomonas vulcanisoli]